MTLAEKFFFFHICFFFLVFSFAPENLIYFKIMDKRLVNYLHILLVQNSIINKEKGVLLWLIG